MIARAIYLSLLCGLIGSAAAGVRGVFPADTPAAYYAECAGCHIAYPPDLLSKNSWGKVMGNLNQHFDTNVQMEEPLRKQIEEFLQLYSGRYLGLKKNGSDIRVTNTLWFNRMHGKTKKHFGDNSIVSGSNCAACHVHADDGRFDGNNIPANAEWSGLANPTNANKRP